MTVVAATSTVSFYRPKKEMGLPTKKAGQGEE
jgi:hypothetical protein